MKVIEVRECTPAMGQEYLVSAYPGDGAYLLPDRSVTFLTGGILFRVFDAGTQVKSLEDIALRNEGSRGGISESTLLRAIALVQQPGLVTEMKL